MKHRPVDGAMFAIRISHVLLTCGKKSTFYSFSGIGGGRSFYSTCKMAYSVIERGALNSIDYRVYISKSSSSSLSVLVIELESYCNNLQLVKNALTYCLLLVI